MDAEKIKEIIAKYAKTTVENLKLEDDLKKDLHLDSIDLFQMVMEAEEAFNIKVDDNQLLKIKTVKDALDSVKNAR